MITSDLAPLDRPQLLHEMDLRALRDSRAPADLAGVRREVERWAEHRLAEIDRARTAVEEDARARLRQAESDELTASRAAAQAARAVVVAEQERDRLRDVLRGLRRGDDGGDWSASARLAEDPRRAAWVDALVYGGAAVCEGGLSYLAFRLMGTGPGETALLAAAVVPVAVLLPEQLGRVVASARRTGRLRGWPLAALLLGGALWLAVALFASVVRTAFLMLPATTGPLAGLPPLLAVAGIEPWMLTAGWLAVALAVGAVVGNRSVHRHNPYATAWHTSTARVAGLRATLVALRARETELTGRTAAEDDALRAVADRFTPAVDECRALAAELVAHYEHLLGRRRGSAEQHRPSLHARASRPGPPVPGCAEARITDGTEP